MIINYSENIINIIEDYSEIEYYKNHNQPIRLELEYTMMGSLDEINIVYRNEYFYLLKESTRDSSIIYCKYDNERNIKYYEYDYSKMNCDCPIHKGAKMHTYYKEHKLKSDGSVDKVIICVKNLYDSYQTDDTNAIDNSLKILYIITCQELKYNLNSYNYCSTLINFYCYFSCRLIKFFIVITLFCC